MTMHLPPTIREACGTVAGYMRHQHTSEYACKPCMEARRLKKQDERHAAHRRAVLAEAVGDGSYGGKAGGS